MTVVGWSVLFVAAVVAAGRAPTWLVTVAVVGWLACDARHLQLQRRRRRRAALRNQRRR